MALEASTGAFFAEPEDPFQLVEGMGFRPDTIVVWWSSQSAVGREHGCRGGVGFAAGGTAVAAGWYANHGTPRTETGSAAGEAAIVVPVAGRAPLHGKLAFADDGFSLEWDSPLDSRLLVHYLCLGGVPHSAAGGLGAEPSRRQDRIRLGFAPDLVLVAAATREPCLLAAVGAAGGGVSATNSFVYPNDAPPDSAVGFHWEDAALGVPRADPRGGDLLRIRPYGEGFDIEWEGTSTGLLYLALSGVRCRIGTDASPVAPGVRRSRPGFEPQALLAFTKGIGASNAPRSFGRLCIGAAAGSRSVSTAWFARGAPAPVTATGIAASHEHLLLVPDTKRDRLHASARLEAFHADGFSLRWLDSDGILRRFAYVALADRAVRTRRMLPSLIASAWWMRSAVRRSGARRRAVARSR